MSPKPKAPPARSSDTQITSLPSDTVIGPAPAAPGATAVTELPADSATGREMTVEQLEGLSSSPGFTLPPLDLEGRPDATREQPALDLPEPPRNEPTLANRPALEPPPRKGGRKATQEQPARRTQGELPRAAPADDEDEADPVTLEMSREALEGKRPRRGAETAPTRVPGPTDPTQSAVPERLRRSELALDAKRAPPRRRTVEAETDPRSSPPQQQGTAFIRHGHRVLPGERPGHLPRWAPAWSEPFFALPNRQKAMVGAGAFAGLMVLLLFYSLTRPAPAVTTAARSDDRGVARLVAEGRTAMGEKRYEAAAAAFDAASRLAPDDEEVQKYRAFATRTRDEKGQLDLAGRAREGKRYAEAREALKAIPPESEFADTAKATLAAVDEEEAQHLLDEGRAALKAGNPERAAAQVEALIKLNPGLAQQLSSELGEVKGGRGPSAGQPGPRPRGPAQASDAELQAGFAAFAQDPGQGADAFERLAATAKGATQKRAQQLAIQARACAGATSGAGRDLDALEKAAAACAEVSPDSPPVARLRDQVAERARAQAEEAVAAEDLGREAQAYRHILSVKPGDSRAGRELKRLLEKAHDLYLEGYANSDRDPDGAIRLLRQSLSILTPADADYAKAKAKLGTLKH